MVFRRLGLLSILVIGLLSGCLRDKRERICFLQKEHVINNVGSRMATGTVSRVVVLPLFNYGAEISEADLEKLQNNFLHAFLKKGTFECIFEKTNQWIDFSRAIPRDLFENLKSKYAADAVLFMGITHYSPYVPVKIGVKMQLIELVSHKIIWGLDEVFDASQEEVFYGVRRFQRKYGLNSFETLNDIGQLSPGYFSTYVGEKICETLPESF